ncbi:MAG: hypothetical protein KAY37_17315 [Phycisphaerae bacterium]|nr:hypothetical protein [Phycisphaerae bacterium]
MKTKEKRDGIEFTAITSDELSPLTGVAASLDNQWIPQRLLDELVSKQKPLSAIRATREKLVRAEFVRSLINCEQVVVNRAYFHNNPVLASCYQLGSGERETMKALLNEEVLVPYLYNEDSPAQRPGYAVDPALLDAWLGLCGDTCMPCVRLSWDGDANKRLIRTHLQERFHAFAQTLNVPDPSFWANAFLIPHLEREFANRLTQVAQHCVNAPRNNKLTDRQKLYEEFVAADKNSVLDLVIASESKKPFACQIKQLLDLRYNCNLSDALQCHALTGRDSIPRVFLQEWEPRVQKVAADTDAILSILKAVHFDLVQRVLYSTELDRLPLRIVRALRATEPWRDYRKAGISLLESSGEWTSNAEELFQRYVGVTGALHDLLEDEKVDDLLTIAEKAKPVVEFAFDFAGVTASVLWPDKGVPFLYFGAKWGGRAVSNKAPFIGRIVVRAGDDRDGRGKALLDIPFLQQRLEGGHDQWDGFVSKLKESFGKPRDEQKTSKQHEARINETESADG